MDQKRFQVNGKRLAAGCVLGAVLAIVCPFLTLTELFAALPMVLLPSVGLLAIYAWAGRAAVLISALMQMVAFGYMLGPVFMWIIFLMAIQPVFTLMHGVNRPFFSQLKYALFSFGMGMVFSVAILYLNYGGDMVGSVLTSLENLVLSMPLEQIEGYIATYPGMPASAGEFLAMMEQLFSQIISSMQLTLPGQLFAGTLLTSLSCVTLLNRMRAKAGIAGPGSYVPLSGWYLPSSATTGLLLILLVGFVLMEMDVRGGETVFYTILTLDTWVFCIQALASISRRTDGALKGRGARKAILIILAAIALLGASHYLAIYGCASALMGSRGAVRQYAEEKRREKEENDGPDDWDE